MSSLSLAPLIVWCWLLFARGSFWRCRERDTEATIGEIRSSEGRSWPNIVAIIPARDEAELIRQSIGSLLRQDYPGRLSIIIVDDQSHDGTSAAALSEARSQPSAHALHVIAGAELPDNWTGKLWAMRQGVAAAESSASQPDFFLFVDADITLSRETLRNLVFIAQSNGSVLTSLMVKLRCESSAERWLTPAFVFFFQMLYPFAWVKNSARKTAAAAGGCMLVRRDALGAAGGLEALGPAVIDDCALALLMKRQGPIWLGLTSDAHSLRAYPSFADFGKMVSRSAFAELCYSTLRLAATVAGMSIVYLLPPVFAVFFRGEVQIAGTLAWLIMSLSFIPTLRFYRQPWPMSIALPAIAALYLIFTFQSALEYWQGRGGYWKGRVQARNV